MGQIQKSGNFVIIIYYLSNFAAHFRFNPIAQVVNQISALWSSARERVFGEDYWIPTGITIIKH